MSLLEQRMVQKKTSKHTRKSYEKFKVGRAKRLQKCWKFPSFDEVLSTVTPIVAKRNTNMRETVTHSQRLSNTQSYLASGFEDLKLPLWTYVLVGGQKINVCILSNISADNLMFARLQVNVRSFIETIYWVKPFNIKSRATAVSHIL